LACTGQAWHDPHALDWRETVSVNTDVRGAAAVIPHHTYLDGWRGLAITALLVGHFFEFGSVGQLGVELFFVLSGRLMADILFVRKLDLPTFFLRRVSRIFPALLFFATTMLIVATVAYYTHIRNTRLVDITDYFAAIFFATNYLIALTGKASGLAHTWSIAVEEHAYTILAIIAAWSFRRQRAGAVSLAILTIACMANGIWQMQQPDSGLHETYWRTDVRLASITASATIFLMLQNVRLPTALASLVAVAAFAAGVLLHNEVLPLTVRYTVGTLCLALAINLLDNLWPFLRKLLEFKLLTWLGTLSYSIYLWQQPFAILSVKLPAIPLLLAAIAVGFCSYKFIERPTRTAINAAWLRRKQSVLAKSELVQDPSIR
jgi:peptidoglycan/LPS O-acetylase OafA/YrhL